MKRNRPVHRRIIVPWWDSEAACILVLLLMASVFGFALAGLSVCLGEPAFRRHLWLPGLLMALSGSVAASTFLRLLRRRAHQAGTRRL